MRRNNKKVDLYLIRHGIALARDGEIEDAERPLTVAGRQKTEKVAKRLGELKLQFDLILTSPLVRARQTAQILHEKWRLSSQLDVASFLQPGGEIQEWLTWLDQWQQNSSRLALAIVGHQPDLGHWAEILVWAEVRDVIVLKKAGIIGLTLPKNCSPVGCSKLFWLTPPKLLL